MERGVCVCVEVLTPQSQVSTSYILASDLLSPGDITPPPSSFTLGGQDGSF